MNTEKSTPVKEDQAQERPAQEAQELNGAQLQDGQAEQAAALDIDPETEAEFERRMNEIERQTDEKLRADLENMTPEQRKEFHQALQEAVKAMTEAMMPIVEAKAKMQAAWQGLGKPIEEGRKELQEALKKNTAIEGTSIEEADQGKKDSAHDAQEVKDLAGQIGQAAGLTEEEIEFVRKKSVDRLGANAAGFVVATVQAITKLTQSLAGTMGAISAKLEQWRTSDTWQALQGMFTGVNDWIDSITQEFSAGNIYFLAAFIDNINDLMPYLQEELDAYKEETGRHEISLAEFMQDKDPETGAQIESIFSILLNRAKDRARKSDNPAAAAAAQNIETARRTMENLPVLESISRIPKNYVITNDALSNSMTGRADKKTGEMLQTVNAGAFDLPILPASKKKKTGEVTAYTMITFDEQEAGIEMRGKPFTEYDRCVMNGVVSLWEAGNKIITADMVQRTMASLTRTESLSPQQIGAVTKSLEKMRRIFVTCDLTEAVKRQELTLNGEPVRKFKIDDHVLSLEHTQVTAGGKTKDAYKISAEPILLRYSRLTGQLVTADLQLLDIKKIKGGQISAETIPTTEARQPIKEYLLRRIEIMKHDRKSKSPKQSNVILFDTLYRETGVNAEVKQYTKNARDYVFQVLDYWTAAGYISGYEIQKEGKKLHGVAISF